MIKKRYYQCLIVQEELFRAGIDKFRSGLAQTYYTYMLRFHRLPPSDKTMKQLQDQMKQTDPDASEPLLPTLPVPAPAPMPSIDNADPDNEIAWEEPEEPGDVHDPSADSDSSFIQPPPESPLPSPDHVAVAADSNDAHDENCLPDKSDSDSIAADVPAIPSEIVPPSDQWPAEVMGIPLKRMSGRQGGTNNWNPRLGVQCPCCIFKTRSTALLTSTLGEMAPVIYLGSWLQNMGEPDHRDQKPSMEAMLEYKALHFAD